MLPDRLPLVGMALDPNSRRQFLAFLAGSPLLAAAGLDREWLTSLGATARPDALLQAADTVATAGHPVLQPPRITRAADALDVFDFEGVAQQNIPVAHWGYLMTGTDDDGTISGDCVGGRVITAEGAEVDHAGGGPAESVILVAGVISPADDDGAIGGDGLGVRGVTAEGAKVGE